MHLVVLLQRLPCVSQRSRSRLNEETIVKTLGEDLLNVQGPLVVDPQLPISP